MFLFLYFLINFLLAYLSFSYDCVIYFNDDSEEFLNNIKSAKENIRYKLGEEQLKNVNEIYSQYCKQYDQQLQNDVLEQLKNNIHKSHFSL